jgi:hypothetical protein
LEIAMVARARKKSVSRSIARRDALSRDVLAVAEFVQVAEKRYRSGGERELRSWLSTALNELLQHNDRVELVAILLGHAFDSVQKTQAYTRLGKSSQGRRAG